jgi:hypothetical protein
MKTARYFAIAGTLIMFVTLIYGFVSGNIWEEGSILTSLAWGQVSLIDVYVGFAIIGGWIIFRENNTGRSVLWILGIFILGNFLACLYIWIQIEKAGGNVRKFWFGNRPVHH